MHTPRIPDNELRLEYVRASGPGGQNVNKTSTKAQLRWNVNASQAFSEKEKAMIRHALRSRMTNDGDIALSASETRSQQQNRETAVERLERLVAFALTPKPSRIPTRPTRASKERRLGAKKIRQHVKRLRTMPHANE